MDSTSTPRRTQRHSGTSYKFQRLREKIRQAVGSGELSGKLPGERELARRFHVNAKTLSKALTDLAAEGLLHRSIGRGTFVKGTAPQENPASGRWLFLTHSEDDRVLLNALTAAGAQVEMVTDALSLRPSYLNQFAAVIDASEQTPQSFLRDLVIRNIPVVTVGREARTYSTSAVLPDIALGSAHLTRELMLGGHRRFLAVEERNHVMLSETVRVTGLRSGFEVTVDACCPADLPGALEFGATACICASVPLARQTVAILEKSQVEIPHRLSVSAVGWADTDFPCTGYYVSARQKAAAINELLRHGTPGRPTTLWLPGTLVDRQTTALLLTDAAAVIAAPARKEPRTVLSA